MVKTVAVVGLGYVGLTLALTLADAGLDVFGVEKSLSSLKNLQKVQPPFFETGLDDLLKKHLGKNFKIGEKLPSQKISTYILCVGTPLDPSTRTPNLTFATQAVREIAAHMQEKALVILRSTVPVGISRKIFLPLLEKSGKEFHVAYCPERTSEGVALRELKELPQIIGGREEASTLAAKALFQKMAPQLVVAPSLEAAELMKLMDNCWRDATFAFANEIAALCEAWGLDANHVIGLANSGYARNKIPKPGFVGGPCLTKDPFLLNASAVPVSVSLPFTKTAREVNELLVPRVWDRFQKFLKANGKSPAAAKVFLSGLAFKGYPATDDTRESSSLELVQLLRQGGVTQLCGHDFVVTSAGIQKCDLQPVTLEEGFQKADAVFFLNNHASYKGLPIEKLLQRMNKPSFFFDAWHFYSSQIVGKISGITYAGIGF